MTVRIARYFASNFFCTYLAAGLVWVLTFGACSQTDETPLDQEEPESRQEFLSSQIDYVFLPTYQRMVDTTDVLEKAISDYSKSITDGADSETQTDTLSAARDAFRQASAAVQEAELLQLGPYGSGANYSGGLDIRSRIYSWPLTNRCNVDHETVLENFNSETFFVTSQATAFGLDALERLLFAENTTNACNLQHTINKDGLWAALDDDAVRTRRAAYAAAIAGQLATDAAELLEAWTNGFAEELRSAGTGSTAYRSGQQALDELFASLFYFETIVKDSKLGAPLGITAPCTETTCRDALESQSAQLSIEWIQANLIAFERLLHGGEPDNVDAYGWLDLLVSINAADLAETMESAAANARTLAGQVPTPLAEHLDSNEASALYEALRSISTPLKSQFVSVLALKVPDEGAADND